MDLRADSFKGMKRMRLNSGEVVDSICTWALPPNGLEDECALGLAVSGSADRKGSLVASNDGIGLVHRVRITQPQPSSTSSIGVSSKLGSLGLTMSLSTNTENVNSWTSADSFCSEEPGLGLTLMPPTSGADSVVTSMFPSSINHACAPDVVKPDQAPSLHSFCQEGSLYTACNIDVPMIDEGSTSNGGHLLPFLKSHHVPKPPCSDIQRFESSFTAAQESPVESEISWSLNALSGTTSTSGTSSGSAFRERAPKMCRFTGCTKRARGASGLCISHGGGRRCQRLGCKKGAEGSTIFCKAHGGGRRCEHLGCTKSAEGKTDFCIAHGGGSRCSSEGCPKAARGRTGFCIRHGGGKRCQKAGCTKSAEGYSALCIAHGGGKRCQYPNCGKGAQGSTMFCKGHGGGKRCTVEGCNKGAEGSTSLCKGHGGGKRCMFDGGGVCTKSVHGGTLYCVAHGGGKRCAVEGCTKSARGRTDCCVKHGGGKRCKFENCDKSAQGSTDFCKAHGGGKRCMWGQESFLRDGEDIAELTDFLKGVCDKTAKGKLGLCAEHTALVQDRRVHGISTFAGTFNTGCKAVQNSLSGCTASDDLVQAKEAHPRSFELLESPWQMSENKEGSAQQSALKHGSNSTIPYSPLGNPGYGLHANNSHASHVPVCFGMHMFSSQPVVSEMQHPASTQFFGLSSMHWQTHRRHEACGQGGSSSMEDDRVFNMSSLSLPEERVHGGNIMALLSGGGPQGNQHSH